MISQFHYIWWRLISSSLIFTTSQERFIPIDGDKSLLRSRTSKPKRREDWKQLSAKEFAKSPLPRLSKALSKIVGTVKWHLKLISTSLSRLLSSHILFRNVVMVVRTSSRWQEKKKQQQQYPDLLIFQSCINKYKLLSPRNWRGLIEAYEEKFQFDSCNWGFWKYRIESSKPLVYFTFLKIQRSTYKLTFSLFLPGSFHPIFTYASMGLKKT